MDLKDLDLNLLVVFNELQKHGRVAAVAQSLGISQPGVSNASAAAQAAGDELFLRTARHGAHALRAIAGPAHCRRAGRAAQHAERARVIRPARQRARLRDRVNDVGESYFLPRLMRTLEGMAPGVTIRTVRTTSMDVKDEMERGRGPGDGLSAGL